MAMKTQAKKKQNSIIVIGEDENRKMCFIWWSQSQSHNQSTTYPMEKKYEKLSTLLGGQRQIVRLEVETHISAHRV